MTRSKLQKILAKLEEDSCNIDLRLHGYLNKKLVIKIIKDSKNKFFMSGLKFSNINTIPISGYYCLLRARDPINFFNRLCGTIDNNLRETYKHSVKSVIKEDLTKIQKFHNRFWIIQKIEQFIDIKKHLRIIGKIHYILTFGLSPFYFQAQIDHPLESYIAWSILDRGSEQYAEGLLKDVNVLERKGEQELAQQARQLSLFYRELTTDAYYGQQRMKKLLEDKIEFFSQFGTKIDVPNPENIKEIIIKKIYN